MPQQAANPNPFKWTYAQVDNSTQPEPFDHCGFETLSEVVAPDGVTVLLLRQVDFNEETLRIIYYGIEAPRDCPMRQAFEWGEIGWEDFWTHQEWIHYVDKPFFPGPVYSHLMRPSAIDPYTRDLFREFGDLSPYEIKRRRLEWFMWFEAREGYPEGRLAEREYQDFMARHGQRLAKAVA